LQCTSFPNLIVKIAATLTHSRAESWFSAWRWERRPRMRPWAEPALAERELAELRPEQAGTPKQLIGRIVKWNLRPALGACFGTPRIKDAWPGTAGRGLAPELTEYAFSLRSDHPRLGGCKSSTHSTVSGLDSTFGRSRLTTTGSWPLRTSTQDNGASSLALISWCGTKGGT
jgi:hypothetical protein